MKFPMRSQQIRMHLILIFIIPLGFATKFYVGPGSIWVSNYLGGIIYVVFFILLVAILLPNISQIKVSISVLCATCILEIMQLWHPYLLEIVRSYFIGRALIGNGFDWFDFPYYILGTIIGYFVLKGNTKLRVTQ